MTDTGPSALRRFWSGIGAENPTFRQILGICSTLAVTNVVMNTVVMCAALVWTVAMSSFTVSLLRNYTPRNVRMMVETLIIAFYVILVDLALKAYWPEMSENLGAYVGLVITNCIVMGRAEGFAMKNGPWISFLDGIGNGLGYGLILMGLATIRELFGSGSLFGVEILPLERNGGWYNPNGLLLLPPSAFFMIGIMIWVIRSWKPEQIEET